jgi:predicted dehydrogenase
MSISSTEQWISILGAGGFSRFSVKSFLDVPNVKIAGVYDKLQQNAESFSKQFGCKIFDSQDALLADSQTGIVYIATPPHLHFRQSKQALLAGKHVICEKPAAFKSTEVEELLRIAREKDLLYVVNLMQRYNPLFEKTASIIQKKLLGEFLHGYFENYASSESLDENHWMWDENLSGGIFTEHAVHFFDLFEGWLGKGKVVASQKIAKKGIVKKIWPEVQAVCSYGRSKSLINFYHGFHQADRMDRQELRLVFELGDITLHEWVPSTFTLHGLLTSEGLDMLKAAFPDGEVKIIRRFDESEKTFMSNFKTRVADFEVVLETGRADEKYNIYRQLLTDMLADQLAWINNRNHPRIITGENGLKSTQMAESANDMALKP